MQGNTMEIIVVANQKGGVGKTTTCNAIATGLGKHHKGYKVLAIDTDPQGNFSFSCGVNPLDCDLTVYELFHGKNVNDAIVQTELGFDLIPSSLTLAGADMEFTRIGREQMLNKSLSNLEKDYDYIIIDTPPTLGVLSTNALSVNIGSMNLIIPMMADIFSIQGLSQLAGFVDNIREYTNPNVRILGLLITKYKQRQNLTKALIDQINEQAEAIGTRVFESKIRESVAIREAALLQLDIYNEAPNSNAVLDYEDLLNEILEEL